MAKVLTASIPGSRAAYVPQRGEIFFTGAGNIGMIITDDRILLINDQFISIGKIGEVFQPLTKAPAGFTITIVQE